MPNSIWFVLGMIAGQLLQIVVTAWFIPRRIMCQRCQGFGWTNECNQDEWSDMAKGFGSVSITSVRCPECIGGVITVIPIIHKIKTFRYNKWTKWLRK